MGIQNPVNFPQPNCSSPKLPHSLRGYLFFAANSQRRAKHIARNIFLVLALLALITSGMASTGHAEEVMGLPSVRIPKDNPQTPEKITLGKRLFEDKRLSGDGSLSCSSCHNPSKGFADGLAVAEGIGKNKGTRNTPTLLNAPLCRIFLGWQQRQS